MQARVYQIELIKVWTSRFIDDISQLGIFSKRKRNEKKNVYHTDD